MTLHSCKKLAQTSLLIFVSASLLASCNNKNNATTEDAASADQSQAVLEADTSKESTIQRNRNQNNTTLPFFGELHVHSRNSPDAFITGVRVTPEDAYRYGRGESIDHISGVKIQNREPLDFMAVTDHAEYMGILPALSDADSPLANTWFSKEARSGDRQRYQDATMQVLMTLSSTPPKPIEELVAPEVTGPIWQSYITLADAFYEPGVFTTFVAYEWTLIPDAQNLHRNIIFAGTDVPALPFSAFDSDKPEELWQWLDETRKNGSDVIAIPHNSNVSDGMMFQLKDSWGNEFTQEYAELRMRNEPIVEVSQIKGTSETHPILSPGDEWADFEILQELLGGARVGKISGSYVREAYLNGLKFQADKGFNPYQFGLIAASDSHNASVPVEEDNYTGKIGLDATAEKRRGGSFINSKHAKYGASGLTGVWAEENTREAIFAAMRRKEVFATSGPKISVRLFAGDYPDSVSASGLDSQTLYANGIAMGNTINSTQLSNAAPRLYIWAGQDSNSAKLQRLQIIKGWYNGEELQEQVFDVACGDGSQPDPTTHRCQASTASVDLSDCSIKDDNGSAQLAAIWDDPSFNAKQQSFYYARVLENPSCRWTSWDALRNEWPLDDEVPSTLQERAWSSPLWYQAAR